MYVCVCMAFETYFQHFCKNKTPTGRAAVRAAVALLAEAEVDGLAVHLFGHIQVNGMKGRRP